VTETTNEDQPQTDSEQNENKAVADKTAPAETHHKRPHKRQHKSHFGIWLLLIVIVLIAGGMFYAAQLLTTSRDQFTTQLHELQLSQQAQLEREASYRKSADAELAALHRKQEELTGYIDVIRSRDKHLRKDWLVLEAEYLIQLANYRLLFERDINTAMVALHAADVRLKDAGDPALIKVRKEIANSVQALKQIEQVDHAGLSLTLTSLNGEIAKLPLNTPDPIAKAKDANTELNETKKVESWTELPAAMWRDIKSLIVIRDHEQPVGPLLSPEQRFFLVENLRLQLEQARLAMLSGQAAVYRERISTATEWVGQHFDKEAAVTKAVLDTLKQLQAASIAPALPDISAAYHELEKYRGNVEVDKKADVKEKPAELPADKPAGTDGSNGGPQ